ncbi:hypothetical protein AB0395_35130 [Streptosporangium sp. NPDC051023]|uniref:hypothetical protein n=1 Tax=Streptosporangium sp. NPDC051023 TaxID=3155410 RepID=UPI00344C00B0
MTTPTNETTILGRIGEARQVALALEPLRELLNASDQELRDAVAAGVLADIPARTLANRSGLSQDEITSWDVQEDAPPPEPIDTARIVWALHLAGSSLTTLTKQTTGRALPTSPPSNNHLAPAAVVAKAAQLLEEATANLARAGAALDYHAIPPVNR